MIGLFNKLPDRKSFLSRLERDVAKAGKNGNTLGLLVIRLARLRDINYEYGYEFADKVVESLVVAQFEIWR